MGVKISVIIPIYNVEQYLTICIESVLNQSYLPYEIILVNDGSTDNSGQIAREYEKKHNIIKCIEQENKGLGEARNQGIINSSGDYLIFIDSDDYIHKDMLKELANELENTDADIVIFNHHQVLDNGEIIYTHCDELEEKRCYIPKKDHSILLTEHSAVNKIFKRDLFIKNNIYFSPKIWYEDLATLPIIIVSADKIYYLNKALYFYRKREGSITRTDDMIRENDRLLAMDHVISYFKKNKKFELYYEEIEFLALYYIYIRGILKLLTYDNSKQMIKKFKGYVKQNFVDFKKNKYKSNLSFLRKSYYYIIHYNLFFLFDIYRIIRRMINFFIPS